ncbi:tetratricopeptide repeat protein, partial [Microcystis viridis]
EAIRLKPDDEAAWLGKGNQLANLGRYEEALSAYEEAIRLKPDYTSAIDSRNLVINKTYSIRKRLNFYENELSKLKNGNDKNLIILVIDYLELSKISKYELDNDILSYQLLYKAYQLSSLNNLPVVERCSALLKKVYLYPSLLISLARYKEADEYIKNWLPIFQDSNDREGMDAMLDPQTVQSSSSLLNIGNELGDLGRYEEALSAYEEAIRLKPDYEAAWYSKGACLGNLGRYEEAIAAYDEAIKLKADYIEAIFNKAILLKKLGHQDIVNQQFHLIVETCQQYKNKDNQTIDFWNVYAASLTCLGQYEEVEQILQKALAINPNHPNTNYNLACYYAIQDNIPLAVEYLAKAIQLRPSDREQAKKDSDFDKIRQDPRFIELISDNF